MPKEPTAEDIEAVFQPKKEDLVDEPVQPRQNLKKRKVMGPHTTLSQRSVPVTTHDTFEEYASKIRIK